MVNRGLIHRVNKALTKNVRPGTRKKRTAGLSPRRPVVVNRLRYQRRSCKTLCCDWLASDSAETAIDWRDGRAWLLGAPWVVAARGRVDKPVCSTLIKVLEKSWRISTTERFEPSDEATDRSVLEAALSVATT